MRVRRCCFKPVFVPVGQPGTYLSFLRPQSIWKTLTFNSTCFLDCGNAYDPPTAAWIFQDAPYDRTVTVSTCGGGFDDATDIVVYATGELTKHLVAA